MLLLIAIIIIMEIINIIACKEVIITAIIIAILK